MPLTRPTLTELKTRTAADMQSRLNLGPLLRRMTAKVLSEIIAAVAHQLYGYIQWASNQLFPDTAEREFLLRWATIWGISRIPASFATGNVTFTGAAATLIPQGTILQRSDGVTFSTDVDGVLNGGGSATIAVTAVAAGAASNTDAAVTLTMTNPIQGVSSTPVVASGGLAGGVDEETDDNLRVRLLNRIQTPPQGGAASDYVAWALSIAGVTRAWCYPEHLGAGTVGVAFVTDDTVDGPIPSSQKVDEVDAYIQERRPVTADVTVFAPVAVDLDLNITVSPNTAAVKAAVEAEIKALLRREAVPGGTLYLSKIREAISIAAGENNNVLNSPTANVTTSTGELLVLGTITWA